VLALAITVNIFLFKIDAFIATKSNSHKQNIHIHAIATSFYIFT